MTPVLECFFDATSLLGVGQERATRQLKLNPGQFVAV
jgi:hypothetical protein